MPLLEHRHLVFRQRSRILNGTNTSIVSKTLSVPAQNINLVLSKAKSLKFKIKLEV